MINCLIVLLQVSILDYAKKLVVFGVVDFNVSIGVSYCQAQAMVQESHALNAYLFGLSINLSNGDLFAEIVECDGTVLVAKCDDWLHLMCNNIADWRRDFLEIFSLLEHSRLVIENGHLA